MSHTFWTLTVWNSVFYHFNTVKLLRSIIFYSHSEVWQRDLLNLKTRLVCRDFLLLLCRRSSPKTVKPEVISASLFMCFCSETHQWEVKLQNRRFLNKCEKTAFDFNKMRRDFLYFCFLLKANENKASNLLRSIIQRVLHRGSVPFIDLHRLLVDPPLKHQTRRVSSLKT